MRDRVVGDEAAIQSNGFSIEHVGESFVGCRRISKGSGRECESAHKVLTQLPIDTEADPDAGAVAIWDIVLVITLAAYPNVTAETEPPGEGLQCCEFPMRVLLTAIDCGELSFE